MAAMKKPHDPIRIPVAMENFAPPDEGTTSNPPTLRRVLSCPICRGYRRAGIFVEHLVGIDCQNPVEARTKNGVAFL